MQDSAGPQFILSGARDGTSTIDHGAHSDYWSSLASTSATNAHSLYLNGTRSTVHPVTSNNKRYGFSLRCLAQ